MKRAALFTLAVLLLAGCSHAPEMDPTLLETSSVSLTVKGKSLFVFDEETSQMSWDGGKRSFRAGNDDMTSYFILTCADLPHEDGQILKADIFWKTGGSLKNRSDVAFQVGKTDLASGQVWLWSSSEKIGAVIRIF